MPPPNSDANESGSPFINLTHPSQQFNRANKRKVASYIGTHYRNRSKPAAAKPRPDSRSARRDNDIKPKPSSESRIPKVNSLIQPTQVLTPFAHDTHGLRSDPFESYPIPTHDWVPEAVDFFLNAYGPTHLLRSGDLRHGQIVHEYFQYGMQHPVMFETLIACSLGNLRIAKWARGSADDETMFHYGSALTRLQGVLASEQAVREDAVLFAVLGLLDIEYLLGNTAAFEVHIQGLCRIVELRGGLDSLGWSNVLKPAIVGVLALSHFVDTTGMMNLGGSREEISDSNSIEAYFSGMSIASEYPALSDIGFRQLIDEGRLSDQVILHANHIFSNFKDVDLNKNSPFGGKNASNIEARERGWSLLMQSEHTLVERLMLLALQHTVLDLSHAERFSQCYFQQIMKWTEFCIAVLDQVDVRDSSMSDLLIWCCMKLAGSMVATFLKMESTSEQDPRFQMALKMLNKYPSMRNWESLATTLKKFPWQPPCDRFWYILWKWVSSSARSHSLPPP